MKMPAKAIIACGTAFAAAAFAARPPEQDYYADLGCVAADGEKAIYMPLKGAIHASRVYTIFQIAPHIDLKLGENEFKAGKSYIAYFKPVMDILTPEVRDFYFAHECAHHRLGHGHKLREVFLTGRDATPAERYAMEETADCAAARELRHEKGYSREKMELALGDLEFGQRTSTHPEGRERIQKAMRCAGFQ